MKKTELNARPGENSIRSMYELAPYPDLGADLKDLSLFLDPIREDLESRTSVRWLDAGCGTGHYVVSAAKSHPQWSCYAMDLSEPSLEIARKLAERHGANVEFRQGSYLDKLPFDDRFDVICALGTIHHCEDPVAALRNIRQYLADDGYLLFHLYGQRADQKKFDIKDALSVLEPDLGAYETRFRYYRALIDHRNRNWLKRLATTTPLDVYAGLRNGLRNLMRKRKKISWSPGWDADYPKLDAPWIDHFCNPLERAYEVPEIKALLEAGGFEVAHMLKQGREHPQLIPAEWRPAYDRLGDCDKWRLSELLAEGGGSFAMVCKKA